MAKIHKLKVSPKYFKNLCLGKKNFELRYNDRDYQIGDRLELISYIERFGRINSTIKINADIKYILSDYKELKDGFIILGLANIKTVWDI